MNVGRRRKKLWGSWMIPVKIYSTMVFIFNRLAEKVSFLLTCYWPLYFFILFTVLYSTDVFRPQDEGSYFGCHFSHRLSSLRGKTFTLKNIKLYNNFLIRSITGKICYELYFKKNLNIAEHFNYQITFRRIHLMQTKTTMIINSNAAYGQEPTPFYLHLFADYSKTKFNVLFSAKILLKFSKKYTKIK